MSTAVVRSGIDTWVGAGKPNANHVNSRRMVVDGDGPVYSLIHFRVPAPPGATIISATLRVTQDDAWSGSHTLTLKRITQQWKAGKVTYNSPTVGGPTVTTTNQVAVTKVDSAANTVWDFNVTALVQAIVDSGTVHFGWRLESSNNARRTFYSLQAGVRKPTLTVVWSDAPDAPTTLVPDGGVVSVDKPVLRCDYTDVSGNTDMAAIHVQIDAANDFTTGIDFDSGEVASVTPELDLAATAYAGLAAGASTWWRVRVKDGAGIWSEWSQSVQFTRQAKGSLTITNPAADPNDFVEEYTPAIAWSHTGTTQSSWRVMIADTAFPSSRLYDSGRVLGTASSHTLPAGVLKDGRTYTVTVHTWDQYARTSTPGDPPYVEASRDFTVNFNAGVTAASGLTVAQEGNTPGVRLTWTRGTFPDSWTITRNGEAVVVDLDPADTLVSGTTHSYVDWAAPANQSLEYAVRPVVNGQTASGGTPASVEVPATGVWLGDPETGEWLVISGRDAVDAAYAETATTYEPMGATSVVRITASLRGLEGTVDGPMRGNADFTMTQMRDAWTSMKERPEQVFRLAWGHVNVPVVVGLLSKTPHPDTRPGHPVDRVSFSFWQQGELPFEARL